MLNFRFAKDYLLHRLRGKTRHGTHSPFVYGLLDKVVYDDSPQKVYGDIENLRRQLLSDQRVISVTDLGAGSRVDQKRQKKISDIARNALKPPKLAQLLYRIAADLQPQNIIELGTCLGITTLYLRKAAPGARLYTLEGCPQTAAEAAKVFEKAGEKDIIPVNGNFDDTLPEVIAGLDRLDMVYIDGNHTKEATLRYFEWCLPKVHNDTLLIFDDIYWSEGMKEAWAEIKAHPQVTVTIDLFWIGLVYFRKGQAKEDFLIRF
ncbi:MAG TPA: class I SAM-dependent methyltransferase [Mucilaginibacter sp.]|nr:class I SAM-dependent methyltransferase [Mucilaginibacter sp.]